MPTFYLRRFAGPKGRLTVVHLRDEPLLIEGQRPEQIGVVGDLNSWRRSDGTVDDWLEQGPAARLDSVAAECLRGLDQYADAIKPEGVLRLLDWDEQQRVPVYMFLAGLMVRGPSLRDTLDETALPSLLAEMGSRLEAGVEAGETDPAIADVLREALTTPGRVVLNKPENRHPAAFMTHLEGATAGLGSTFLVALRRVPDLLLTGSEPVVLLPSSDFRHAKSFAEVVGEDPTAVRLWDEKRELSDRVVAAVSSHAGALVPLDRRTVALLFDPDKDESGRLLYAVSRMSGESLATLSNVLVAAKSQWIAGPPDRELFVATRRFTGSA